MIINLIKSTRMFSLTLPQKIKGQYWITDIDDNGETRKLISVEAKDNQWIAKSNKSATIVDSKDGATKEAVLTNETFLLVALKDSDEKVILFTEDVDETRHSLKKICINEADILSIGHDPSNNIIFDNPFVSGEHAKIAYDGTNWLINDLGSRNGTYVNGMRITKQQLFPGDLVYIMGLKIVIGGDFFALNNPDEKVKIKASSLSRFENAQYAPREIEETNEDNPFIRSPHFHREVKTEIINIDPPPALQKIDTVPMALMLGPSLTMGMSSAATGVLTLTTVMSEGGSFKQALPTLIMSVSMLIGTVLWPILTKKYEKKQKLKAERARQEKYLAYLNGINDKIREVNQEQCEILNENFVSQEECVERIAKMKDNLWEKTIGQTDFLKIRLGMGTLPADIEITFQKQRFSMEDDTLQNAMTALAEQPQELRPVPVTISLADCKAAGVYGKKKDTDNLIKVMITQMIALHSYDELKLMLFTDETDCDNWAFVKNMPHVWSDDHSMRFFGMNLDDAKDMTAFIEKTIDSRLSEQNKLGKLYVPHYVIIVTSNSHAHKFDGLRSILESKENIGFTILYANENISDFPKETSKVIFANGQNSLLIDQEDITKGPIRFTADEAYEKALNNIGKKISNITLDASDNSSTLPSMMTFLEMFSVGKVEHLNCLTRWKENNPTKTLKTPVGVDSFHDTFYLDLHEKFHGPHGLVAGMTGSGKSEYLITYILSLAVNYHPDEVAFILIDYKGGGLAGAFEDKDKGIKLPHLAGVITNLDGASLNRTLVSFQSERRRREAILNKARKVANEGTMDIYKYQQLYRDKVVSDPLPHLFIIADEFAELKVQQPDFMEQLISLARVGRSLGIHLILATQKPSGVVDDQIWSNSKFRVCLKVQEKSDSQDMIKRPDAAEISQTGRFYLQVGFNELFAMGQSAWCGADYVPSDIAEKAVDNSIIVVDNLGRTIMSVKPPKKASERNNIKQIVAIVNYLSTLADEEHITVRSLWLEPIPAFIYVADLERKYFYQAEEFILNPIIGELDDPFNQRQELLMVPFSTEGNCLVYGATGNGKATFVTTLVYSLLSHHGADEVNLFIMDFGSETMKVFEKAPQVGNVILANETEKVTNLFRFIKKEIENRKEHFSEFGGDYNTYIKSGNKDFPNIVVVLNNYSAFSELYEDLQEDFAIISRDGTKYGIYFVVTASATNAIRYKTQQNFKMVYTMQLNDVTDYMVVVGRTDGLLPAKYKGRGLVALDKVYEFQTAYCAEVEDKLEYLRKYCSELSKNSTSRAKAIPILPEVVDFNFILPSISTLEHVPVGVNKHSLDIGYVNLASTVVYPVLSNDIIDIVPFADTLINVCEEICHTTVVDAEKLLGGTGNIVPTEEYDDYVQKLFDSMVERNNTYKDAKLDRTSLDKFDEEIVVIFGIRKLLNMISEQHRDDFYTFIDKADSCYKYHFILIDSNSQMNSVCSDVRLKSKFANADGLWIGEGVTDQYLLKNSKITADLYQEIGTDYGYLFTRGRHKLIKILSNRGETLNG